MAARLIHQKANQRSRVQTPARGKLVFIQAVWTINEAQSVFQPKAIYYKDAVLVKAVLTWLAVRQLEDRTEVHRKLTSRSITP